jgi:hypothetical protein
MHERPRRLTPTVRWPPHGGLNGGVADVGLARHHHLVQLTTTYLLTPRRLTWRRTRLSPNPCRLYSPGGAGAGGGGDGYLLGWRFTVISFTGGHDYKILLLRVSVFLFNFFLLNAVTILSPVTHRTAFQPRRVPTIDNHLPSRPCPTPDPPMALVRPEAKAWLQSL